MTTQECYDLFRAMYQEKSVRFFDTAFWAPKIMDRSVRDVAMEAYTINPDFFGVKKGQIQYSLQVQEYPMAGDVIMVDYVEVIDLGGPPFPRLARAEFTDKSSFAGIVAPGSFFGGGYGEPGSYYVYQPEANFTLAAPAAPALVPSAAGGALPSITAYYVVVPVDANGAGGPASAEANAAVVGPTGSVAVSWNAIVGAATYRVYRGLATGQENVYFTTATNSFTDVGAAGTPGNPIDALIGVNQIGFIPIPNRSAAALNVNYYYHALRRRIQSIDAVSAPDLPQDWHPIVATMMCVHAANADGNPNVGVYAGMYNSELEKLLSVAMRGRGETHEQVEITDE